MVHRWHYHNGGKDCDNNSPKQTNKQNLVHSKPLNLCSCLLS